MAALAQQPTMAPVHDGGMAPVQNGTNATGTEDAYSIVFLTQQFEVQVDDNGNGDERDYSYENKIDMGDNSVHCATVAKGLCHIGYYPI